MELVIKLFLIVSIFLFLDAIIRFAWMLIRPYYSRKKQKFLGLKNPTKVIMHIAVLILCSVWTLRLAVGLYESINPSGLVADLPFGDQVVNSLLHALMSFSMDEDFTGYLKAGKLMIEGLFKDASWLSGWFSAYSALMNVAAPIAGGAIIFDIIAELSPQFHFKLAKIFVWRKKYYFTALNEQSLSLAKDIVTSKNYHRSTIIFTDAYADDENEESSERLLRAKALGAICLKDDLMHIPMPKSRRKPVRVFLSDRKENDNLEILSSILSWKKRALFKNLEIYVFSSDRNNDNNKVSFLEDEVTYINNRTIAELQDRDAPTIEKLKTKYEKREEKKVEKKKNRMNEEDFEEAKKNAKKKADAKIKKKVRKILPLPKVTPVNGVRNMAQNLFYEVPLFEGLYGKTEEHKTLRLTIFGSGVIGTEVFLNAYWMGQMLDVLLDITIVSQEKRTDFENKINYLNPEILRTIEFVPEKPGVAVPAVDPILEYMPGKTSEPYARLTYLHENVMSSGFMQKMGENPEGHSLIDSDYFVVALGSDEDNFTVADKLRQKVGYYHLNNADAKHRKAIISYVVYNSELCETLNQKSRLDNVYCASDQNEFDIYMHAFGSMDEVYSMKNVMFDGVRRAAEQIGNHYRARGNENGYSEDSIKRWDDLSTRYYEYRANVARRLHLNYKVFSAGELQPSLFCSESDSAYESGLLQAQRAYKAYVDSREKNGDFALLHRLSWLEHRRWNALMRICGFTCPDDFSLYMKLENNLHAYNEHKFIMLKLHPCIVESAKDGIHAKLDDAGKIIESEKLEMNAMQDKLDLVTVKRNNEKGNPQTAANDFKRWDYPECEKY